MARGNSKHVVDLFSGAGGLSLGAHEAGFSIPLAIDKDPDLTSSIEINFPNLHVENLDLGTGTATDVSRVIKNKVKNPAGVIGGPPCQGFSYIGKRDPRDQRNKLVFRFFEIVNELSPEFFLFENVQGIMSEPFNYELEKGLNHIGGSYNIVGPIILNAKDFGVPTSRPRVFVIGSLNSDVDQITEEEVKALQGKEKVTVSDAIKDLPSTDVAVLDINGSYWAKYSEEPTSDYSRYARKQPRNGYSNEEIKGQAMRGFVSGLQPTQHTAKVLKRYSRLKPGEIDKVSRSPRLKWDGLSPTIRAGTGKDKGSYQSLRPIHPSEDRVISVREAARLQGFPDWFQFHPTIWHSFRMIGNSVSPVVAQSILGLVSRKL